jgi:hypothetical protein
MTCLFQASVDRGVRASWGASSGGRCCSPSEQEAELTEDDRVGDLGLAQTAGFAGGLSKRALLQSRLSSRWVEDFVGNRSQSSWARRAAQQRI